MSDAPAEPITEPLDSLVSQRPTEVMIAAVVTWVGSSIAVVLTLLLAVVAVVFGSQLWDAFGLGHGGLLKWVLLTVVVAVALAALGDVAAYFLLRRRRWAHWVLIGLCVLSTLVGVEVSLNTPAGLLVCVASVAVIVMLFAPNVRKWLASSD